MEIFAKLLQEPTKEKKERFMILKPVNLVKLQLQ